MERSIANGRSARVRGGLYGSSERSVTIDELRQRLVFLGATENHIEMNAEQVDVHEMRVERHIDVGQRPDADIEQAEGVVGLVVVGVELQDGAIAFERLREDLAIEP
jgi:hypothetical protein